jgi:H+/gluconate symporter-like permease
LAILIIIGVATSMAWALTQSGFSTKLAEIMSSLPGGRNSFIAVSLVAFIILGSVLEGIPAIVLLGPLLFPIASRDRSNWHLRRPATLEKGGSAERLRNAGEVGRYLSEKDS